MEEGGIEGDTLRCDRDGLPNDSAAQKEPISLI